MRVSGNGIRIQLLSGCCRALVDGENEGVCGVVYV